MHRSIINLQALTRLSDIFPCVIWKDYTAKNNKFMDLSVMAKKSKKDKNLAVGFFDKNTDFNFHQILNYLSNSNKCDYDIIDAFYKYKYTNNISKSRKNMFHYLLPPESEFKSIINIQNYNIGINGGIYFFFNKNYVEEIFLNTVYSKISQKIEFGELFPQFNGYNNPDWICYYNNNGPRFTWDANIDWKNFNYSVNTPWKGFEQFCQYKYTLVLIGYENEEVHSQLENLTSLYHIGYDYLLDIYKLKNKPTDFNFRTKTKLTEDQYEQSEYARLRANINYGIEKTIKKNVFHIKNTKETIKEINYFRKHYDYEKKEIFKFNQSDKICVNRIYEKYYEILPEGYIKYYAASNFTSRYDELKKILAFLKSKQEYEKKASRDISIIEKLILKIESKTKINDSDTVDEDENNVSLADKKAYEDYKNSDKSKNDELIMLREIINTFAEKFSETEKEFSEWILIELNKKDGLSKISNELYLLINEDINSEIIKKYANLYGVSDVKAIIPAMKGFYEDALEKVVGKR